MPKKLSMIDDFGPACTEIEAARPVCAEIEAARPECAEIEAARPVCTICMIKRTSFPAVLS